MKLGILTQPLHTNYGGLLQSYALQSILINMGHDVWLIDRDSKCTFIIKIGSIIKHLILNIVKLKTNVLRVWPTSIEEKVIRHNTDKFIKENIKKTEKIYKTAEFSLLNKYRFDVIIVGSDQVWRPLYSPFITNYFLDFLKDNKSIKRIAYAASLGVDYWEFTPKQTEQCSSLAQLFNAISVREESAINLCKQHLKVEATHVLDPTMLLSKEDYIRLIDKDRIPKSEGTLMTYILDQSPDKKEIIKKISKELRLIPFSVMPKAKFVEVGKKHLKDCIYPPVTEWIRGFMDAEYVVTDSFHGTVFSIIFNKPFLTIGNNGRGMTRFTSLLKLFGLEERLIASSEELTIERINMPINFIQVNLTKEEQKKKSIEFLNKALNN